MAALDLQGLGVAAVVAKEEAERGARFDPGGDAVLRGVTQKLEALLLRSTDAKHADHHAEKAREAGYGKLLDADGHVGIRVLWIDFEDGLAVVAGLEALTCRSGKGEWSASVMNAACMPFA